MEILVLIALFWGNPTTRKTLKYIGLILLFPVLVIGGAFLFLR